MRGKLAAAILILYVNPAFGQTASDIEVKYGKPVNAYSVSEHIWMTPEYTIDGRVCQMRLYPKRIAPNSNYLFRKLPFEEMKRILNQLVPLNARGTKKESFGITTTGGGVAWTTYPYEKVTFTFTFSFRVEGDSWKESKTYDFPVQEFLSNGKLNNTIPSEPTGDDFSPSQTSNTEIVTIEWHDRKCAEK